MTFDKDNPQFTSAIVFKAKRALNPGWLLSDNPIHRLNLRPRHYFWTDDIIRSQWWLVKRIIVMKLLTNSNIEIYTHTQKFTSLGWEGHWIPKESIPNFNSRIHHFTLLKCGIHFWHWKFLYFTYLSGMTSRVEDEFW